MTSSSGVAFVLFFFVFLFILSLKPRPFVQSSFDMQARGEPGSTLLSGGYAPDSAKAEGSSIVDEPGEG